MRGECWAEWWRKPTAFIHLNSKNALLSKRNVPSANPETILSPLTPDA